MRRLVFVLLVLPFLLVVLASQPAFAAEKYTIRQRFGTGMDQHDGNAGGRKIDEFQWQKLGIGWYFDWGNGGGPRDELEYMGLAGGYGKGDPACSLLTAEYRNKQKYPDGMLWVIGNEIGWDDGRTADEYADSFAKWYDCLRSINPTFKVGSGALVSLGHKLPRDWNQGCSNNPAIDGGAAYFKTYINRLRNAHNKVPDFIVSHAYTYCRPGAITVENFKTEIQEQRLLMKELGLQNKDLILKEWADFSANNMNYLSGTVDYLLGAKDQNTGNPDDEYRLVQKWAWFVLNNWKNSNEFNWETAALANTNTGELKLLGEKYRDKADASPLGSYSAGVYGDCTLTAWSCDPSSYDLAIQIDWYVNDTTTNNQPVFLSSTTANQPNDAAVKSLCNGNPANHGISFPLPKSSSYRDGKEHTYYAAGINIGGDNQRRDYDSSGRLLHTWLGSYISNKMTCASAPPVTILNLRQFFTSFTNIFDYNILVGSYGH